MSPSNALKSIANAFRSVFHKPKVEIKLGNIVLYLGLGLIFLVALLLRLFPAALYDPLLKAFDPWFQYRCAEYLADNGLFSWFTWHDPQSWYPWGRDIPGNAFPGLPMAAATVFYLLQSIGISVDIYTVCFFLPAFLGATSCIAMYFLGKEVGGRKVGIFAALLLAFIPAHIQRTVAGFFDNETIGILTMVLTAYFFLHSFKHASPLSAVAAGLSLGYLSITWGAYQYLFYLLALFAILLMLARRYTSRLLMSYSITTCLAIFIASRFPVNGGVNFIFSGTGFIAIGVLAIMALYEIFLRLRETRFYEWLKANRVKITMAITGSISAAVIGLWVIGQLPVLIGFLESVFSLSARFWSVLNPLSREQVFLVASVGEHATTTWAVFYYYLHVLVFLVPVGLYFSFKRLQNEDLFIILFSITSLYFAGSMIRLLLILAPIVSLLSAITIVNILKPFATILGEQPTVIRRRRKRITRMVGREYAVASFGLIFILLTLTTWHSVVVTQQLSTPEMVGLGTFDDWRESFQWMRNNLDQNVRVLSWWDYGYWITTRTNKTTYIDNGTLNSTQIAWMARALISNETEALKIFRMYDVTHVLVHFGYFVTALSGDEGKWIWMVRIAQDHFPDVINESEYYVQGEGPTLKFFQSLIYKLVFYEEPGDYYYSSYVEQIMSQQGYPSYVGWPSSPEWRFIGAEAIWPAFSETYVSTNHLVKIFELNYDVLDYNLTITDTDIYRITTENKTAALVDVKNSGSLPMNVDLNASNVLANGTAISDMGGSAQIAEGSSYLLPGETCVVKINFGINATEGEAWNFTMGTVQYYGNAQDTSNATVRLNQTINMDLIGANAYSNETVILDINNTGAEYLEITQAEVNGTSSGISIASDTILYPGQNETYRIVINLATNPDLNLNETNFINITIFTWEGVNQTVNATVQIPPDYSILIRNATAYSNETIFITIENTGNYSITLNAFNVSTTNDSALVLGGGIVGINGTKTIEASGITQFELMWDPADLNLNQSEIINTTAFTLEGINSTMTGLTVLLPTGYNLSITQLIVYDNATAFITVNNTGNYSITVNTIYFFNTTFPSPLAFSNITAINGTMTILPGEITEYMCVWDPFIFNATEGTDTNSTVLIYEGFNVSAYNTTLDSQYAMGIANATTHVYSNGTIVLNITNNDFYSIHNITIQIKNATTGEVIFTYFWQVTIDSFGWDTVTFDSGLLLTAGEDVIIQAKSIEGANDQRTKTVEL
ncbi:MAG: STT3 domain-containing protein [Promethearchaeota archaeon]